MQNKKPNLNKSMFTDVVPFQLPGTLAGRSGALINEDSESTGKFD